MLTKNLMSIALAFLIVSCGGSSESETQLTSINQQSEDSFMIVANDVDEYCKVEMKDNNLISSELLNTAGDEKPAKLQDMEQEISQLNLNGVRNCDEETKRALKQLTSGETQVAAVQVVPLVATIWAVCIMTMVSMDGPIYVCPSVSMLPILLE